MNSCVLEKIKDINLESECGQFDLNMKVRTASDSSAKVKLQVCLNNILHKSHCLNPEL